MQLTSSLPFPHLTFKHWDLNDQECAVLIVKATWGIRWDGRLRIWSEPLPLVEVDQFWGESHQSSIKQEQDLAPFKPKTDIIVNAHARVPLATETPLPEWPVALEIKDRLFYEFYVRGPCQWQQQKNRWQRTEPKPVTSVPIRYELAYGGSAPGDSGPLYYDYNPVGKGFVSEALLASGDAIAAAQIGDIAELMAADIQSPMAVHGLGAIAKTWLPRRASAGTFDDSWKNTRHPRMPKDYSFAFWNAAHQPLQMDPHLKGDEVFVLRGLQHSPEPYQFCLPSMGMVAHQGRLNDSGQPLALTDVLIDIANADPLKHRVALIWRTMIQQPDSIGSLSISAVPL